MKIGGIARSSNSSLHNMLKQDKEDIVIVNLRHIQDQNQETSTSFSKDQV